MCPGNTASFEEMLQWWRAVGNAVPDLTGPRFEPQTSRSRDERVTARPTALFSEIIYSTTSHISMLAGLLKVRHTFELILFLA